MTTADLLGAAQLLVVVAYLWLAVASIVLAAVDIAVRRLPDGIVVPTFVALAVLFAAAAALGGDPAAFLRALAGAAALLLIYLIISVLSRGGMGFGDVKLAAVLGLATGWIGWEALVVGTVVGFVLGGLFGLALVVLGRAGRGSAVPFGPWMLAGAWAGILAGPAVWGWYAGGAGLGAIA